MRAGHDDMTNIALDIDNLTVGLGKDPQGTRIIDGVSLQVREGETLCLVGESGSGKSVTSLAVMGLLQKGSLAPRGGSIRLVGEELLGASDRRLRQLRATTMAMIFQNPLTALNPIRPVGRQIADVLIRHTDLAPRGAGACGSGNAGAVGITDSGAPRQGLSARNVRRHAPARHDRDCARRQSRRC